MNQAQYRTLSVHKFNGTGNLPFNAAEYSYLKFGSDIIARKFGYQLADEYFKEHAGTLLSKNCVVIPSPYNHIKNAATIMTEHFVDRINDHLVSANGGHVDISLIKRKVSYTSDYGFLPKEKRQELIAGDDFYFNYDIWQDKHLIFVDDIKITGTHEEKLRDILFDNDYSGTADFIYFAEFRYEGINADIEAELNFAGIKNMADYVKMTRNQDHRLIVRPIKFILSQKHEIFEDLIFHMDPKTIEALYYACLGEGYYKVPGYQHNFGILMKLFRCHQEIPA